MDGATTLHKEKEWICRQQGNKGSLQKTLGSQAILLAANLGCAAEARGRSTRRDSNRFVDLDPQQRAMLVSKLLVVLCSDRHTQMVVQTGTERWRVETNYTETRNPTCTKSESIINTMPGVPTGPKSSFDEFLHHDTMHRQILCYDRSAI